MLKAPWRFRGLGGGGGGGCCGSGDVCDGGDASGICSGSGGSCCCGSDCGVGSGVGGDVIVVVVLRDAHANICRKTAYRCLGRFATFFFCEFQLLYLICDIFLFFCGRFRFDGMAD